jgi:hypothetical protein
VTTLLVGGEVVTGDHYVSAMPVDALKLLLPGQWAPMPFFKQLAELEVSLAPFTEFCSQNTTQ